MNHHLIGTIIHYGLIPKLDPIYMMTYNKRKCLTSTLKSRWWYVPSMPKTAAAAIEDLVSYFGADVYVTN